MSDVGKSERETQNRIVELFRDELGYKYLGDWTDREDNSNVEEGLLTDYLTRNNYTPAQISAAIYKLRTEADHQGRSLYGNNQAVYNLLRYGVQVKTDVSKATDTVHLIDWKHTEKNDFAIAEEVTLHGNHDRRPDLVLYINGIAIGVLELKNSRVGIVLWLSAYMHESDGRPGSDSGTGWSLPARLVVENGEFDRPFPSPTLGVIDGQITVGDRVFGNCIPLPFDERGEIRVFLSGAEGELLVRGDHAYMEPVGPAVYIEEVPGSDEDR